MRSHQVLREREPDHEQISAELIPSIVRMVCEEVWPGEKWLSTLHTGFRFSARHIAPIRGRVYVLVCSENHFSYSLSTHSAE